MQENLLTIQKAANFLGVVAKTLRRWEKKGVLTPQRTSGNQRRYLLSELDKIKQEIEQKKNRLSHGEAVLKSIEPLDLASSFKLVISNISRAKKILLASLPIMILVLSAAVVVKGQLANANKLATSKLEYVADVRASNSAVLGAETQAPDYLFKVNVPSTFVETATFEKDVVVNGSATFLGPIKTQNGNLDLGSGKLSASNIIYGLTAGNGISVGNSQAPTISNTGVTSIQGKTGNVVLTAGSGLALDGLQINNTDVGSAQDIFKNITIGSTTITAGSNTDTLNLAAGSGVTLTSNSTTKTITISTGAQAAGVTSLQGQTGALTFTNGNGVSINGLQISNSGVLSLGGQAGALNLSSGSGISVSGLTVTNTDLGSSQNIFKNIGIGSSLITAGINNDTLQLASGSGIIISSNPFTNTATFGLAQDYSIQAAGWTKTGNYVNLSTLTDYVGIGTATPFATLDVLGNSGVLPVGNFYGNTSASVLAVNNDGVGDLFAASASGFPIFTINGNGNISDSLASSINFSGANLRVASCTGCVSLAATGDLLTAVGGSSTNIAPTGVASASTVNNAPQYAIDGSDATGWQAGDSSYPQWLRVDFPNPVTANAFRVLQGNSWNGLMAVNYQVQTSTDGTTWATVSTQAGVSIADSGVISLGSNVTSSHWRLYATTGTGWTWVVYNFELFTPATSTLTRLGVGSDGQILTANSSDPTGLSWETPSMLPLSVAGDLLVMSPASAPTDIAPTGAATASSTSGGVAQQTIDGSDATGWQAGDSSYPQWLRVDFPNPVTANTFRLLQRDGTYLAIDYALQTSADGLTWTTVNTQVGVYNPDSGLISLGKNVTSSHWRLYATIGSGWTWDVYTFQLFSPAAGAPVRLAVGTNGQVLMANSAATNGIDWETPSSTPNFWQELAGASSLINTTSDFLIGGNSTASAIFSIQNVNRNLMQTPLAYLNGNLGVAGSATIGGTLTVGNMAISGNITTTATSGTEGWWQRSGTILSTTTAGDSLSLAGAETIAPSGNGVTALTLRAPASGSGNILNITNSAGTSSYMSIDSSGSLTLAGSTFSNSGAIHLTSLSNAILGTAILGGWSLNGNTFDYRRQVVVQNADGVKTLPVNYQITQTFTGTDATDICANSRTDNNDIRVAYNGTEISRNIVRNCAGNSVTVSFQLQATIAPSASNSNYYVYYSNASLASAGSTYIYSPIQLENADTLANWASSDQAHTPISQDTSTKEEGTGSVKLVTTPAPLNVGTGADGTLDLSLGSGAGGCTGTGLSWSNPTCTVDTSVKATFNFTNINIPAGTTLIGTGPTMVTLYATGTVSVAGTINMDGLTNPGSNGVVGGPGGGAGSGFGNGTGAGGGGMGATSNSGLAGSGAGGGGFGGTGGAGASATAGAGGTAGSSYSTVNAGGSGGGDGGGSSNGSGNTGGGGGGGGGSFLLNAAGNITISSGGIVSANGGTGHTGYNNQSVGSGSGGGGSGGQIQFSTFGTVTNSGTIRANGANGIYATGSGGASGGGGGGRVTIQTSAGSISGSAPTATGGSSGGGAAGAGNAGVVSTNTTITPSASNGNTIVTTKSPIDLSTYGSISVWVRSDKTGQNFKFGFGQSAITENQYNITVNSANTWELKTFDISAVPAGSRNAITTFGFIVNNANYVSPINFWFDDVEALPSSYSGSIPSVSSNSKTLGASNLALNSQGSGAVVLNYDTNGLAGAGGLQVYNGSASALFTINASGSALLGTTNIGAGSGAFLALANVGTAPSAVANQGFLYVTSGALKYRGPSTLTSLANADYAESMPFKGELKPAEIVSVSSDAKTDSDLYNNFLVEKSSTAYDPKTIGIVSQSTSDASDTAMIAMVGRVPVKVTTENGAIQPGDYITSSSLPGVGMKATKTGVVVGKALQAYDNSDPSAVGEVLVLVNISYYNGQDLVSNIAYDQNQSNYQPFDKLNIGNAIIDTLNVTGRTVLNDLGVTGKINSGVLVINGLDDRGKATINTLAGDLYIQNEGIGGVNILAGKVTINPSGNVNVSGVLGAQTVETSSLIIKGSGSVGNAVLPAGQTQIEVGTASVTPSSKVFITPNVLTNVSLAVTAKKNGSFTVQIPTMQNKDISFDWWVVGTK